MTEGAEAPRCMGDNKSNRRCGNEPLPDSKYCLVHKHLANYSALKNGRYSAALGRLSEAYETARNDASLMDLREPMAAMDAIVQRLMKRLDDCDTMDFRTRARGHLNEYLAHRRDNPEAAWAAIKTLQELLKRGGDEDRMTNTLVRALQAHQKRIEGAWEIMLARRSVVNANDLVAILARFLDICRTETSRDQYARIVDRADRELMRGSGRAALMPPRTVEHAEIVKEPDATPPAGA